MSGTSHRASGIRVLYKPECATLDEAQRRCSLPLNATSANPGGLLLSSRRPGAVEASGRPSEWRKMQTGSHMLRARVRYSAVSYVAAISIYRKRFSSQNQKKAEAVS